MFKGFGAFLARGNVLDLAVAVVIGAAFTAVVTAFVKDVITPLIAALLGKPDFSAIGFTLNGTRFPIGDFLNAVIAFLIVALVIYYVVIVPFRVFSERSRPPETVTLADKICPECLSEVPLDARRCKYCTSPLINAAGAPGTISGG